MIEHQLVKLLLKHTFYVDNKDKIVPTMFPDDLLSIVETVQEAHTRYERDISIAELRELHKIKYPTLPTARRTLIAEMINDIEEAEEPVSDMAQDIITAMWRREIGRQIAAVGVDIMDGKSEDLAPLKAILDKSESGFVAQEDFVEVTSDVAEVLSELGTRSTWTFNIPTLANLCPGISGGELMIIGARPNAGKTALPISLSAAPGGFCHQGALVHYYGNEEPVIRTRMRSISSCSGMTREQIELDPEAASLTYAPLRDTLKMFDAVGMQMASLDTHIGQCRPQIVIIDQLDKVEVGGKFNSETERLRQVYLQAREIAKRYDCAVIGLNQASADADGKQFVHFSMFENSKTGKAAEADLIVGIGVENAGEMENMTRCLFVSKNKISGAHGPAYCVLNSHLSRYEA